MGKPIDNALGISVIFTRLSVDILKQRIFLNKHVSPVLIDAQLNNDGTLTTKDLLKINRYYGLLVPSILGEAFCILRNKKMTEDERWASTSQGVITGLFDDFFDDLKLDEAQILEMVMHPETISGNTTNERVYLNFYLKSLEHAAYPERIKKQLLAVHRAQLESLKQEALTLGQDEIWEITKQKGGESVLFYRTAFNHRLEKGEAVALYQLGALMQLENDVFDLYKDAQGNIDTLPTTIRPIQLLRKKFDAELEKMLLSCRDMDYPRRQVSRFLDRIMPIICRAYVAFEQYEKLEGENNAVFNINSFTRKQLICDLEKPRNFLKAMYYQIKKNY